MALTVAKMKRSLSKRILLVVHFKLRHGKYLDGGLHRTGRAMFVFGVDSPTLFPGKGMRSSMTEVGDYG